MIYTLKKKEIFLKEYNINLDDFEKAGIDWLVLESIYNDYQHEFSELEPMAQYIVNRLIKINKINFVKYRIKTPDHLIEKLIRKKIEDSSFCFSSDDYKSKITDIIGIRAIHLFKEDWLDINRELISKFDLKDNPIAYIRKGDDDEYKKEFEENGCKTQEHKKGYRSVHYSIDASMLKNKYIAEIQVRTIFEEGWSEIDHKIRYPYVKDNLILEKLLSILNRSAGSADELGSFIVYYLQPEIETYNKKIGELNETIDKLEINKEEKYKLKKDVSDIKGVFLTETFLEGAKSMENAIMSISNIKLPALITTELKSLSENAKKLQDGISISCPDLSEYSKNNLEIFKPGIDTGKTCIDIGKDNKTKNQ